MDFRAGTGVVQMYPGTGTRGTIVHLYSNGSVMVHCPVQLWCTAAIVIFGTTPHQMVQIQTCRYSGTPPRMFVPEIVGILRKKKLASLHIWKYRTFYAYFITFLGPENGAVFRHQTWYTCIHACTGSPLVHRVRWHATKLCRQTKKFLVFALGIPTGTWIFVGIANPYR